MVGDRGIIIKTDERTEAMVRSALAKCDAGLCARSPSLQRFLANGAAFAAVVDAALTSAIEKEQFRHLKKRGVEWPVIQILRPGETRAQHREDWSAGALAPQECRSMLPSLLRRSIVEWCLAAAAESARITYSSNRIACDTIEAIATSNPPLRNVAQLEIATAHGHSVIFATWNLTMRRKSGLHLAEFMAWVLLLRALGSNTPKVGWRAIARRLGTTPGRLTRHSLLRYGVTLTHLEEDRGCLPVLEFIYTVLEPSGLLSAIA